MDNNDDKIILGTHASHLVICAVATICFVLATVACYIILFRYFYRSPRVVQQRNNKSGGVKEEILNKIPTLPFSTQKFDVFRLEQNECSICLGELEDGEPVRLLPACKHAFHPFCIESWFIEHANCPVCRSPITCDCELRLPIALENDHGGGERRISSNDDHHHRLINGDVSDSTSTSSRFQRPHRLLLHSVSFSSSRIQQKPRALDSWLNRHANAEDVLRGNNE
ncbi:Zinc finger, RING-type [Sesbania bispinosa]|nr:Zinc finger, RING-type [Sesbania bispinosa]